MRIAKWFSIVLFTFSPAILTAQKGNMNTTITGTVVDASLYPVANAIVLIDGQKSGVITNSDGKYKVRVKRNAERIGILISGNKLIEAPILGMTRINFKSDFRLAEQSGVLKMNLPDEDINIGYSSIKRKNLTTQCKKINCSGKGYIPYSNIYDMIREKVAGVRVNGSDITINGSDYYLNHIPPLILVDGVSVNSLSYVTPSSVESIVVLKSAAAAIYGTRASGGAILISTREW